MITWKPQQDNYIEGQTAEVKFYMNISKDKKVNSLYLLGSAGKQKYIPKDYELEIDYMKLRAEELLKERNSTIIYF